MPSSCLRVSQCVKCQQQKVPERRCWKPDSTGLRALVWKSLEGEQATAECCQALSLPSTVSFGLQHGTGWPTSQTPAVMTMWRTLLHVALTALQYADKTVFLEVLHGTNQS